MRTLYPFAALLLLLVFTGCPEDVDDEGMDPSVTSRMTVDQAAIEVTEEDYGSFLLDIPVSLDIPNTIFQASVGYVAEGITAEAGTDFVGTPSRVFFPIGSSSAVVRVRIFNDLNLEEDETFTVRFTDADNIELGDQEVTVTILNNDATANPFNIPQGGEDVPTEYEGYALTWSDEFDDDDSFDNWQHELGSLFGGWGNNELQYYQRENAIVGDGHLIITAREENRNGLAYTSSRMRTKGIYEFTYGRVDVRAAMPEGQGIWPAIWMLGANIDDVSWPACGEIDIMEMLGHETQTLHGTVHFQQSGSHRFIGTGIQVEQGLNRIFNVFSIIWTETDIEWRLNDVPYHRVEKSQMGSEWAFDLPQYLLLNCAVGGNWPGSPNAMTEFPQRMFVDYVRVYQQE